MQFYKFFYIKYINNNLLPILLLICAVLFFQYGYNIEHFVIDQMFKDFRKKIEETEEKKCEDNGYNNCFHKKTEEKCKIQKYKNCDDKATQLICKKEGYDDCDDKKNKLREKKSKIKTDELVNISKRVDLLTNNI